MDYFILGITETMTLVKNPSLEPKTKRRKIDHEINESLSRYCDHWFVRYGICISCNSTLENNEGRISLAYYENGIQMTREALAFTKLCVSQLSWLEDKKLHLVLDLDHTLLHTIRVSKLSESDKYLIKEAGSRKDLWRFNSESPDESLIKLRPFVHEFLKQGSEMFSMYVYTRGGDEYAQNVLELIDPHKVYFRDRVITRRESPGMKTLDLVLADERGIVVVDDKRSVWPDHKRNLLQITKYEYFDQELRKFSECKKKKRDETDVEGPLASVLSFLKDVHKQFFCDFSVEDLDSKDVRSLLKEPSKSSKCKDQTGFLDIWEAATLSIKREGYNIKYNNDLSVAEKFSASTAVTIPFGQPTELVIIGSDGSEYSLRAYNGSTALSGSRDEKVLTLRLFIRRALQRKKGKKRVFLFNK